MADAHILPRAIFSMFEGQGKIVSDGRHPAKKSRTGVYDPGILCVDCERHLMKPEDYAIKALVGKRGNWQSKYFFDEYWGPELVDVDYEKMKLFFLALLWKANETDRELFQFVDIGPHRDRLSSMIRDEDPGSVDEFSVMAHCFDDANPRDIPIPYVQADRFHGGIRGYKFVFSGYMFFIKVSSVKIDKRYRRFMLNPDHGMLFKSCSYYNSGWPEVFQKLIKRQKYPVFSKS